MPIHPDGFFLFYLVDHIICLCDAAGICEDSLLKDGSNWDYVRKGVCCICCDSNIDSLLYR